jgi:hypothetical protein
VAASGGFAGPEGMTGQFGWLPTHPGSKGFPISFLYKLDDSNLNSNSNLNPLKEI